MPAPLSRSDAARTRRRARFREMHVHNAPVARFLAEHHCRARDERNAVAPRLRGRVPTDPFRLRMPFAGTLVAVEARRGQYRAAISVIRECQTERIRREDDPLCSTPATS